MARGMFDPRVPFWLRLGRAGMVDPGLAIVWRRRLSSSKTASTEH